MTKTSKAFKTPETFKELFEFYREYVKPVYSYCQTYGTLPQETLFEICAAWDHVSRYYSPSKPDEEKFVAEKASSHLKRSCLDIFKIALIKANDQEYDLKKNNLSFIIEGGITFEKKLMSLLKEIREYSEIARIKEGEDFDYAFGMWWEMYVKCRELESLYYDDRVPWENENPMSNEESLD
jgi:hypothetical protein